MEVFEQLRAFLSSGASWLIAIAPLFYQGAKWLNRLTKVWDWHDKHFVRKRMARLKNARSEACNDELTRYLDEALDIEVFRLASGISASRSLMEYMLKLASTGRWSHAQLRSLSKFVVRDPADDNYKVAVGHFEGVIAWVGALMAVSLWIIAMLCFLSPLFISGLRAGLISVGVGGGLLLLAYFPAKDLAEYLLAKRVSRYLDKPDPFG
ncbi:hypothetical protein ACI2J9_15895 [Pseudomonas fulva]|uniref:hypothetical protein n=1 Tax=Pseudomonas fulva TaxID=47880 RepID=UPI00385084BF